MNPFLLFIFFTLFAVVSTGYVPWARFLLSRAAYYVLFFMFLSWLVILVRTLVARRHNLRLSICRYFGGLFFSLALAAVIFLFSPPAFRIQNDESKLLNTSRSMFYEQRTDNIAMGINVSERNYVPILRNFPQRPLLFPFGTHLIHWVLGYRPSNPFVLNFGALFALFSLVFIFCKKQFSTAAGFSAVLLVAAQPTLIHSATSAGFDLFAVLFMLIAIFTLKSYLETPDALHFSFFWINAVLFAHTRHEASLFLIVAFVLLLVFRDLSWKNLKSSWVFALTPLFLSPIGWGRTALTFDYAYGEAPGGAAFSLEYPLKHAWIFFQSFFRFDFKWPFATGLNLIGFCIFVYGFGLFILRRWPKKRAARHAAAIVFLFLFLRFAALCSFYHGDITHPLNSRYFAPFFVMLALGVVAFFSHLGLVKRFPGILILFATSIFVYYYPVTLKAESINSLYLQHEFRWVSDFMKTQDPRETLLIVDDPNMYTGHQFSVIDFEYANQSPERLRDLVRTAGIRKVYVIQKFNLKSKEMDATMQLHPVYSVEPVGQIEFKPNILLRLSQLKLPSKALAVK